MSGFTNPPSTRTLSSVTTGVIRDGTEIEDLIALCKLPFLKTTSSNVLISAATVQ